MIKYVTGDILLSQSEAIAHGVAPNDDFAQGLALSLREQWPALYKDFRHYCKSTHPKEGGVWFWKGAGGPAILNLLTQEHPPSNTSHPGKASISYVRKALKELRKEAEEKGFKSIALPKIATGVGGLDWNEVKPTIEEILGDLAVPVYVYESYEKGTKAEEA